MDLSRTIIFSILLTIIGCKNDNPTFDVDNGLYIDNVTIISANKNGILKKYIGNVLIDNKTILFCGKQKPNVKGVYTKIDGTGKYLTPGLIDSHVHLSSIAGMNYKHVRDLPELANSYYEQLPNSYLYFGYTTLIDPNNYNPRIIKQIKDKEIKPDIYTCGEQVKVMNDFMMAEDHPKDRYKFYPNFLHDKYNKNVSIPDTINSNDHSVKKVVSDIVNKQGGICMKTIYEDGFGGTEEMLWELPTLDIMKDLVHQAQSENIPVLLHANSFSAQKFGSEANVDIIAHGMWHWGLLKEYLNVSKLPETHKELLSTIADKKIGYQPTFRVIAGQKDVFNSNFINDSNLKNVLPPNLLKWLKTDEGLWQKKRIMTYGGDYFDSETPDREIAGMMQLVLDKINISTNYLSGENGNLLFGSDTPAMNNHANPPGYNGFLEMKHWVEAGISLEKIFMAATFNNANAFHINDKYGTIEKGKTANLLLLNQDPLDNISAYNAINSVIVHGKKYERNTLSARVDD
ncbi:amidohydrolase family protein [Aquimarina sp. AU58]|uniref:amidohydrolase family protein n=1 Tax=Aquimarina sp. AU58 TaxID=1874112 RepID=UPI000D6E7991|nr:amidohydrolase family protein [Aquimarina sp. AU58]